MAGVRKTSGTGAACGFVNDLNGARQRTAPAAATGRTDSAGITTQARALARAFDAVDDSSDVRDLRVRALREQILKGTYKPDPREIARKLVERGF